MIGRYVSGISVTDRLRIQEEVREEALRLYLSGLKSTDEIWKAISHLLPFDARGRLPAGGCSTRPGLVSQHHSLKQGRIA